MNFKGCPGLFSWCTQEIYRLTSFVLVLLVVLSLGTTAKGDEADDTRTVALQQLLDSMVDPASDSLPGYYGPAPGVVLSVEGSGFAFLQAAGFADLENKTPTRARDHFQIGSSTKMFTSVLLLQLMEQKILGLDDALGKWLPDWAARFPNGQDMTLRQLANHTAGIWDYGDLIIDEGYEDDAFMRKPFTPDALLQYALDNGQADFSPGEKGRWKYSNTGYILLGKVIEKAAKKKYVDLLSERIFEPLGLSSTSFPDGNPTTGSVVQGYVSYAGGENATAWNLSQAWAAGGIISTATDMRTFLMALANGRLFKDPATLLTMGDFVESNEVEENIGAKGYGLGLVEYVDGLWGHAGGTPGYSTETMFVPGTDITMVVLTNAAQGPILRMRAPMPLLLEMAGSEEPVAAVFPRPEPDYTGKRGLGFAPFEHQLNTLSEDRIHALESLLVGATVSQLQGLMDSGDLSATELVLYYVDRIQKYDLNLLNSVIELNPNALEIAQQRDRERSEGKSRGLLQGIPVLLKDNIAAQGMHATAGAWAMRNWLPERDAQLTRNLRDAGAIILGKTNLSEWANYMDPVMPSGFSVLGGQTRNPYGPYEVWGSSSGSAIAMAARLATLTVGTETQGSIIMPATINGVVAIKTSKDLLSTDNIIPLLSWMDVPGPMARTVTDAAVLLTAMVGKHPAGSGAQFAGEDFSRFLTADAVQGMRVGVIVLDDESAEKEARGYGVNEDQVEAVMQLLQERSQALRNMVEGFSGTGVELVDINASELPPASDVGKVLPYGFKDSLDRFFDGLGEQAPVDSLAEVIAINNQDPANHAPYGQGYLTGAQESDMSRQEYDDLVSTSRARSADALNEIFKRHNINVLATNSQVYAAAGFPAITVPAGYLENGQPQGLILVGKFLSEPDLLAAGYAFEQAVQARKEPDLETTIQQINDIPNDEQ